MNSLKDLIVMFQKCLSGAINAGVASIAFPSIGAGGLKYDQMTVLNCLQDAINSLSSSTNHRLKVFIVPFQLTEDVKRMQQELHKRNSAIPQGRASKIKKRDGSDIQLTILAKDEACANKTKQKLTTKLNNIFNEETIESNVIHYLTEDDKTNLKKLHSSLFIDNRIIKIKGRRDEVGVVAEKVRTYINEAAKRLDIVKHLKDHNGYLKHLVNVPSTTPPYWSKYANLQLDQLVDLKLQTKCALVKVNRNIFDAVQLILTKTFRSDDIGKGRDARNLAYKSLQVVKVERVENPTLFLSYGENRKKLISQYFADEKDFKKRCSYNPKPDTMNLGATAITENLLTAVNEAYLFHGTRPENVTPITQTGLDNRLTVNAFFGAGIYFAESSTKADQYADDPNNRTINDDKHMFLCRVLLGQQCELTKPYIELKREPCLFCGPDVVCKSHNKFYNSVLGTGKDATTPLLFREFVVYTKEQCYPEYLITYRRC